MLRLLRLRLQNIGLNSPAGILDRGARQIAGADALDLDNIGTVVAEHLLVWTAPDGI